MEEGVLYLIFIQKISLTRPTGCCAGVLKNRYIKTKENKRNFVLDWFNGSWFNGSQDFDSWVRPVSAASPNSL